MDLIVWFGPAFGSVVALFTFICVRRWHNERKAKREMKRARKDAKHKI